MELRIPYLVFFCLAALLVGHTQAKCKNSVKLLTFFEATCKDSRRFIREQLWPVYQELGDIMHVDLVAYGKATDVPTCDGYNITCNHGSDECFGNQMMACARKYVNDVDTYIAFVSCMMSSDHPPSNWKRCADEHYVYSTDLVECSYNVEGELLLHELGKRQRIEAADLYWVPWVIINGKHTKENQELAEKDLKQLICQNYKGPAEVSACSM